MNAVNRKAMRVLGFGCLVCLALALPLAAAPTEGRISGVVVDTAGTPQMGATIVITPEQLFDSSTFRLLTNDRGRFTSAALPAGFYSIKVTLAGFLPAMEQHIQVDGTHAALLQIMLGTVFSSFDKLRRAPNDPIEPDDWTWVLRSSAATRSVLRWDDGSLGASLASLPEPTPAQNLHGRVVLTSGADHPGSVADAPPSPAEAIVYDMGVGTGGQLLMAGQFSYEDDASSTGLATEWLPSGDPGTGPVTTLLVRESQVSPTGLAFRGLRISHDDQFAVGDAISVRYGAEYLVADLNRTTTALRPHGEVAVEVAPGWQTSITIATRPWDDGAPEGAMQSTIDTLDAFPTLLMRQGRPIFESGLHEEIAMEHALSDRAQLTAAVFHDASSHTAVIGMGGVAANADFLQGYFSQAFAYDGGASSSTGARVAYRERIRENLDTTLVYAYGGALAPDADSAAERLRDELTTRYRQSVAARVSTTLPRSRTKVIAGYKWINGAVVSHQDAYGESLYGIDPYLSLQIRQPLPNSFPCHMEVQADMGNLLAQGYVPIATNEGYVVLVPSYRYFRGGLSLQF